MFIEKSNVLRVIISLRMMLLFPTSFRPLVMRWAGSFAFCFICDALAWMIYRTIVILIRTMSSTVKEVPLPTNAELAAASDEDWLPPGGVAPAAMRLQ